MKIKKKTSIMMLAASTAAVVGVAAVSYAAWQGGAATQVTAGAQTGEVSLFGFTDTTSWEDKSFGTFVPYNQPTDTVNGQKVISTLALPAYEVTESYKIVVEATGLDGLTFYAQVGTTADVAAPTETEFTADQAETGAKTWKKIEESGTEVFSETVSAYKEVSDKYVSLILVSEENADMNKQGITFTIKLVKANA